MSTYAEWAQRVAAARRAGISRGNDSMLKVLARLDHPERRLTRVVQIGGTNGKGSTVQLLAAMLSARGDRVGVYTSPHLCTIRERIAVAGTMISEADVVRLAGVADAAGAPALTFFEQLTVMACLYFAEHAERGTLDACILEVGLGGRYDSTTAVPADVTVVTGVALDHEALLGDSLQQIAFEKGGIFRAEAHAVIGRSGEVAAVPHLLAHARAAHARSVTLVDPTQAVPALAMKGAYQADNARAAIAAYGCLVGTPPAANELRALALAQHPGRLETIVVGPPCIVIDGAHNPHGVAALAREMAIWPRPLTLVFGCARDKALPEMLAPVVGLADRVIATSFANDRARPAADVAAAFAHCGLTAEIEEDPIVALGRAGAGNAATIVIAGSLMLVGAVRGHLLGLPADPISLSDPAPR